MFKNEEGFSLLELVVAVGVAGIIAAVALPTFAGIQDKATTTSATYAASASAAEALANSTIGTSGSVNSGASSSQAPAVTITGLTIAGYNNGNVIWTQATASNGEPVIYTVTATSNGFQLMQPTASNLASLVEPWLFTPGTSTLQFDPANGFYAYSRLELDIDGNVWTDHWSDITITASIASNPSVTQVVNG